jgi:hypothetical protein
MQQAKTNHASRHSVPSILYHAKPVVSYAHSTQPLEPTDRPLHHPPYPAQSTSMRRITFSNLRLNSQESQELSCRLTVVASVGIHFIGQFLGAARFAPDLRKLHDRGNDLRVVAGIGPSRANVQGYAVTIDQHSVFSPGFSAVHGTWTSLFPSTKSPHDYAVYNGHAGIEFVRLSQQTQQIDVQVGPNTEFFPITQTAMGRATRTAHFGRNILPSTATDQDKPDYLERGTVTNSGSTSFGTNRLLGRKVMVDQFKKPFGHPSSCHGSYLLKMRAILPMRKSHALSGFCQDL